jgi:hypothetical protein
MTERRKHRLTDWALVIATLIVVASVIALKAKGF